MLKVKCIRCSGIFLNRYCNVWSFPARKELIDKHPNPERMFQGVSEMHPSEQVESYKVVQIFQSTKRDTRKIKILKQWSQWTRQCSTWKTFHNTRKKYRVRDKRAQLFAFLLPVTYTNSPTPGNQRAQAVCWCTHIGALSACNQASVPYLTTLLTGTAAVSFLDWAVNLLAVQLMCSLAHWLIRPVDHATGEWATRVRFVSRMDSYTDWDIKQDPGAVFERCSEVAAIKSVNNWIHF